MGSTSSKVKILSNLDLIEAAQAEYDFIQTVEQCHLLHQEKTLRNAIHRYENYWLPLVAVHKGYFPAPLDIEWVWHCHILNPLAYHKDCQKIVGTKIDHAPMYFLHINNNIIEQYWNESYPNIPFNIDLEQLDPPLISSEKQKSCYDILSACQRQRGFNYNVSLPHFRDKKFLRNAVERYLTMLACKKENAKTFIVSCFDRDFIWHTHQQHVLLYESDTKGILGNILDHNDTTSDRSTGSALSDVSDATKKLREARKQWQRAMDEFAIQGGMYRGEPLVTNQNFHTKRFVHFLNKFCHCKLKTGIFIGFPRNANVIFNLRSISCSGQPENLLSEEINLKNGHHNFTNESKFTYATEHSVSWEISIKLKKTYEIKEKVYSTRVPFPTTPIRQSNSNIRCMNMRLKCATNKEFVKCIMNFESIETPTNYSFYSTSNINRELIKATHIKEVLKNALLMVPSAICNDISPCQYNDHILRTNCCTKAFVWRVVHSQNPAISAIEVFDTNKDVVATSHTIGSCSLPSSKQISNGFSHNSIIERSMLIRGVKGDWALIKANWKGFVRTTPNLKGQIGSLNIYLYSLNGKNSRFETVTKLSDTKFEWEMLQGKGTVDLTSGYMQFSGSVEDITEYICIGCSIALLYVLCQPCAPPPKNGAPYPAPSKSSSCSPSLDKMALLIAAGLYCTFLPRWYHKYCSNQYFNQIHPKFIAKHDPECDFIDIDYDRYDNGIDFRSESRKSDIEEETFNSGCGGAICESYREGYSKEYFDM